MPRLSPLAVGAAALMLAAAIGAAMAAGRLPRVTFVLESAQPLYRTGQPMPLVWRITNGSKMPIDLFDSLTVSGRRDFPSMTIRATRLDGAAPSREQVMSFVGMSTAARRNETHLRPGESVVHRFDLAEFAAINHIDFAPGRYRLSAIFDPVGKNVLTPDEKMRLFHDRLVAPPVIITIAP